MIDTIRLFLALALGIATGSPVANQAQGPMPSLRWEVDPNGTTTGVSVVGISSEALKELAGPAWTADRKASLCSIGLETKNSKSVDRPSMIGSYHVDGDTLRFTPRYPFDRGRTYSATFRPALLPGGSGPDVTSSHLVPKQIKAATVVTGVTPSGELLPENLLKFYLYFSAPMNRGEVYDRVRLIRDDGRVVDLPFLRLAEELWDPTGTRLTLLVDPGRIKRGLRPREESGPVFEAGRSYTLEIDRAWIDADGEHLATGFRKTFRIGVADEIQPDPKTWNIDYPTAATREPLTLTFPEALDRALVESALKLINAHGETVPGRLDIEANQTRWRFTPERPWAEVAYQLVIDADLEDLAGNSILRPFEVDVQRDTPSRPEGKIIVLPITIRPKKP